MSLANMLENIFVSLTAIIGIVTSLFCIGFITCKIKLNPCIKAILYGQTITNLISQILILIMSIIISASAPTIENCRFLTYPVLAVFGSLKLPSMISILRIYMAQLSAKTKIANPSFLAFFAFLSILFNTSFDPVIASFNDLNNYSSIVTMCAKIDDKKGNIYPPLIKCLLSDKNSFKYLLIDQ